MQYFNYAYQRTGSLWEGRYKATVVEAEHYLLTCEHQSDAGRDGEASGRLPVVKLSGACTRSTDQLLTEHALSRRLGRTDDERRAAYRQLFQAQVTKADVEIIRAATNKAWALGNDRFRQKVEALAGRRAAPLPKGRPKHKENRG